MRLRRLTFAALLSLGLWSRRYGSFESGGGSCGWTAMRIGRSAVPAGIAWLATQAAFARSVECPCPFTEALIQRSQTRA